MGNDRMIGRWHEAIENRRDRSRVTDLFVRARVLVWVCVCGFLLGGGRGLSFVDFSFRFLFFV